MDASHRERRRLFTSDAATYDAGRPGELRLMFGSFSPWPALAPHRRATVLDAVEALARDDFGGLVERPYLTPVYLAERVR